jgi:hypothetical protein
MSKRRRRCKPPPPPPEPPPATWLEIGIEAALVTLMLLGMVTIAAWAGGWHVVPL